MTAPAVTTTWSSLQVLTASALNTNFSDLVTYLTDRNAGSTAWDALTVTSSTAANIGKFSSNQSTTELSVDNTATDGDPFYSWKLSGTRTFSLGIDDSDSDALIGATTSLGTNQWLRVPTTGAQVQIGVGTEALPGLAFIGRTSDGLVSLASNRLTLCTNGVGRFDIQNTIIESNIQHRFAVGSTAACSIAQTGDTNTGAYFPSADAIGIVAGGTEFLRVSSASGTQILGGDFNPNTAGSQNTGGASVYWGDISYKTLTDRGCLPWCDNGVEMVDGTILSDVEALCAIKKHPTQLTVHGLPKLDYSTFPKKAYRPADLELKVVERDANDEPIYIAEDGTKKKAADGVEMTMMMGVMIGAFKELNQRLKSVEEKVA
jgi:hypothetical protein